MFNIKIDKRQVVERMIQTGKYVNPQLHNLEDLWFIAYCKEKKYTEQYMQTMWTKIYSSEFPLDMAEDHFKKILMVCRSVRLFSNLNRFIITQSDINYINNLDINIGEKECQLLYLAYSRSLGTFNHQDRIQLSLIKMTDDNIHELPSMVVNNLQECGFLRDITDRFFNKTYGEWEDSEPESMVIVPNNNEGDDKILLETSLLYDIKNLYHLFKERECPICHHIYDITTKTQTDVCQDCYIKYQRRSNIRDAVRKHRNSVIDQVKICTSCNKEFKCSGRSKTTLCPECYDKYKKYNRKKGETNNEKD